MGYRIFLAASLALVAAQALSAAPARSASAAPAREVNLEQYGAAGASLDQRLRAAESALSAVRGPVIYVVNSPATVAAPVTLAAGHGLRVRASITVSATIQMSSSASFTCSPGAVVTLTADAVRVTGDSPAIGPCHFRRTSDTHDFAAIFLQNVHGGNIRGITLDGPAGGIGGTAVRIRGGSGIYVEDTSVSNATDGVDINLAGGNTVLNTRCSNYINCVVMMNGDADYNHGGPHFTSREEILATAGGNHVRGVVCTNPDDHFSACAWAGVAHHLLVEDVTSANAGDMAVDCEGCIDSTFRNVHATVGFNSANGAHACATTFWFTDNITFDGIHCTLTAGGGTGFRIFNFSGVYASSNHITFTNSDVTFTGVIGAGFGGDRFANLTISNSHFHNACMCNGSESGSFTFRNNTYDFDVAATKAVPAAVFTPNINTGMGIVEGNTIRSSVQQPAGFAAISSVSAGYNDSPILLIHANRIVGGFPVDISTTNAGRNPGITLTTVVADNRLQHAAAPMHSHPGVNHDDYQDMGQVASGSNPSQASTAAKGFLCVDAGRKGYRSASACP